MFQVWFEVGRLRVCVQGSLFRVAAQISLWGVLQDRPVCGINNENSEVAAGRKQLCATRTAEIHSSKCQKILCKAYE